MNILLVLNRVHAQNVSALVRLKCKDAQQRLKKLISQKQYKKAFELVYFNAEMQLYLEPGKKNHMATPDYTLVEDLIFN